MEESELTNNATEGSLRSAMLWQKSSFGQPTYTIEQYVERTLTVVGTLLLQRRNLWDYLAQTCQAVV